MRNPPLLTLLALASALSAAPAFAAKVQCWTDDKGQRMCGDRVPPEYADKERKVINQKGYVVETTKPVKTPEEIEAEKQKVKEAEEARKRAEYDRDLLQTYRSVKDLETMRDDRLSSLDSRIRITEKNLADNEKVLEELKGREENLKKQNKPVEEKLTNQIKQYKRSLRDNKKALAAFNREREQTRTKFDDDIARFSALKGLPPPAPAAEAKPVPVAAPAASDAPAATAAPATPDGKKPGG